MDLRFLSFIVAIGLDYYLFLVLNIKPSPFLLQFTVAPARSCC